VAWKKPIPELVQRFEAALPIDALAERRKMFGYPACFVNGHFFAGLHEENFVIRLPSAEKQTIPELSIAKIFDPMGSGKGMKDWWIIPSAISGEPASLKALLSDAFAKISVLPPKVKAAKKKPARPKHGR
jgi:TfoX/Sxy family transcriptional regulator of competence genes